MKKMLSWIRIPVVAGVIGLLATAAACSKSSAAPSAPLDLTGTWSGQVGQPGSMSALRLTWVATHTGDVVSGIATLVKPAFNVQAKGVMSATANGPRFDLTYAVPPDSIPGFSTCELVGLGNVTATNTSMTGTMALIFTSCAGTGLEPPGSSELRLTK
jgi:hypothetical protein